MRRRSRIAVSLCLATGFACGPDAGDRTPEVGSEVGPAPVAAAPDTSAGRAESGPTSAGRAESGPTSAGRAESGPNPSARAYATDLALRPNSVDWSGGDADQGAALYISHCSICHGAAGAGDGIAAVALNPKPRDFRDGTFYIDANANNETGEDVDLARVILEGPGAFGGSDAMQGWKGAFSTDEVRHLIAHLRSLSGDR